MKTKKKIPYSPTPVANNRLLRSLKEIQYPEILGFSELKCKKFLEKAEVLADVKDKDRLLHFLNNSVQILLQMFVSTSEPM